MKSLIEQYFAKNYFIICPRTSSYGGLSDSLMFGYKISKFYNKKILLAVPLFNIHGKHKKKKIFGLKLISILFLKELDLRSKIFSLAISIFLNFNLLLKKILILDILKILIKNSVVESIFPLKLGFTAVELYKNNINHNDWEKIFNQKNYEYFEKTNNSNIISFYVKDQNYDQISEISKSAIADIENYRNGLIFLIRKNYKIRRIGDQLSEKFNFNHENYKDLTFEKEKFEFKQYETLNNCIYYFGCGSAQSSYATFFNKKRVITNLDFKNITHPSDFFFKTDLLLFKKIYFKPLKKIISFEKLFSLDNQILNDSKNFVYIENDKDEILKTLIEFETNLDKITLSEKQISFNKKTKSFFKKNFKKKNIYNIFFNSNFILPNFFLEKYQYENILLDEENRKFDIKNL